MSVIKHALALSAPITLVLVLLLPAGPARSLAAPADPVTGDHPRLRYRIVVDQGKWNEIRTEYWRLPPEVGAGIQAQLLDKLQKSGDFIVMEREATATQQQKDAIDQAKRGSLPPSAVAPPHGSSASRGTTSSRPRSRGLW
jgi:curli biogenesis system outer membrane secretion channel CsgG